MSSERLLVLLILSSVSSQSLTISQPSLAPWNIEDAWTLTGSLTLTAAQATDYQQNVNIILKSTFLCEFPYADCSSSSLTDSPTNTCQCTGHTGDVYLFSVRRQGRLADSQRDIKATLDPTSILQGSVVSSSTERLPVMYKTTAAYGSHSVALSHSSRLRVPPGQSVRVSVELPTSSGYQLTVEMAGVPPSTANDTDVAVTPPLGSSTANVTLTTGGNTATFTFSITVDLTDISTGAAAPDLSSVSIIYIPDIDVAGTTTVESIDTIAPPHGTTNDHNKSEHSASQGLLPSTLMLFLVVTSVVAIH